MPGFFRMEVKTVSRSSPGRTNSSINAAAYIDGQEYKQFTATEAASYISGSQINDEINNIASDYTHKKGVLYSEVVLPLNAPERLTNPEVLWNEVENIDPRKNAVLFREWIACFDSHLSINEMKTVAKEFATSLSEEGMIVHYAIHDEKQKNGNYHVHFLAPVRSIKSDGTWEKRKYKPRYYRLDSSGNKIPVIDKETGLQKKNSAGEMQWKMERTEYVDAFNDPRIGNVERWRRTFAKIENKYLEEDYKVSADSYELQGIDKIPTKHLGKAACRVQAKLEKQVNLLPPGLKEMYLDRILKEVQSDYRRLYYQNNQQLSESKRIECNSTTKLRQELSEELNRLYKYQPRQEYISRYTPYGRERLLIEMALLKLIAFFKHLLTTAERQRKIDEIQNIKQKLNECSTDMLIVYSTGMTSAIENHLIVSEYEMRKTLIKELGEKIRELENEIKQISEDYNYDKAYKRLKDFQSRIEELNAYQSRPTDSSVADAAHRIAELSRTLEESCGRLGESSQAIATSIEPVQQYRFRQGYEGLLSDEKKVRKGKKI